MCHASPDHAGMSEIEVPAPLLPPPAPHPLERVEGMTRRVMLPLLGVEVLLRRVAYRATVQGGMMHGLESGALTLAAVGFSKEAQDKTSEGKPPRARGELEIMENLRIARLGRMATLRNAMVSPRLEELMDAVGGSDKWDDLGLGPDYDVLNAAVTELNPGGEQALKQARTFPVESRGAAVGPGKGNGKPAQRARKSPKRQ